jgi:radical SAM protein with 4Fe4S-binding SPASM domain
MITNTCNKECAFCFQKPWRQGGEERMSIDQLRTFCNWYKQAHHKECRQGLDLMGGEPTQHPQFPAFLQLLDAHEIHYGIFSNGLCESDLVKAINASGATRVMINVDSNPENYNNQEMQVLQNFLERINKQRVLAYTLYNPWLPIDFILDMIAEHKIDIIRISLAVSDEECSNTYVSENMFNQYGIFLKRIINQMSRHQIQVLFDCSVPVCMFGGDSFNLFDSKSKKGRLSFKCMRMPLDVYPNLDVVYCMAIGRNHYVRNILQYPSIRSMVEDFCQYYQSYHTIPLFARCCDCKHWLRTCTGGCIASRVRKAAPYQLC